MSIESAREGRVLHLALNRPAKRNALNRETCEALVAAIDEGNEDERVACVVLSGNGPAFCAGMDLSETGDNADLHERLFTTINRVDKPIVAAVHGAALAGGTGLVANAHIAIAAPDARFGLTEIRIGLWPVLVFRALTLAIGERRATELSITGRIFGADEARGYSLVSEIADDPLKRAMEIAAVVASYSPSAMRAGLRYVREIRDMDWAEAGQLGRTVRTAMMDHADFKAATARWVK